MGEERSLFSYDPDSRAVLEHPSLKPPLAETSD